MCRNGQESTGIEKITGDTVDISEWLECEFYDFCHYWDVPSSEDNPKIRR